MQCTVATHPECGYCQKLKHDIEHSSLIRDGTCQIIDCKNDPRNPLCSVPALPYTHLPNGASIVGYVPDWEHRVLKGMGKYGYKVWVISVGVCTLLIALVIATIFNRYVLGNR